jgi:hypothetical protein
MLLKFSEKNYILFLTLIFITFFNFYSLPGDLFNADQHFWFQRTTNFIKAIKKGEFKDTFQNPKPGVTVMILSGASLETFWSLYEARYGFRPLIYTQDTYSYIDFVVKAPLVIFALVSYIIFYKYFSRVFGEKISLVALIFLGLSPFYTAINRLFHGDGTMNAFFLICIVLLIYYFKENNNKKYLILSAISGGAAFLAKSQAIFLIPYIFLISGLSFLILKKSFSESLKTLGIWLLTFFLTIYILFPAMWGEPIRTFNKIFKEGMAVASEGRNFEEGKNNIFYYFETLPWITNIIFLVTGIFGLILFLKNSKAIYKQDKYLFFSFISIIGVILFYFIQMTLVVQKSDRYITVILPYLAIFSGYLISKLKFEFNKIFAVLIVLSIAYISYFAPYYLALYEKDNWGSLSNVAAEYLNQKNKAENLNVVATPKDHTLRPFFKGKIYNPGETIPKNKTADYLVLGTSEGMPKKLIHCKFEKDIEFRGKLFWKIYNCQKQ